MANTSGRQPENKMVTVPEAVFYDDQFDHILVIARNEKLEHVRTTLQLTDENASKLYHMLGQTLADMLTIRKARIRYVS